MTVDPTRWSIATRLFALLVVFVVAVTVLGTAWTLRSAREDADRSAARACLALATSIADNPYVLDALETSDPSSLLQPYAVALMSDTSTDFVTVMRPDRTRLTHPDPDEIGRPFVGTIAPALAGESFTETYAGTLGPSVRAVVPIESDGQVVALVSAGVTVDNITQSLGERLPLVFAAAGATVLLGGVVSWLLSRYLRRVTWGRGPEELARMFAYYEGVLHSVREGLVLVDERGRLTLYNDQAAELLDLPPGGIAAPVPLAELQLPASLRELLASGRRASDEMHVTDDRVLVVNQEATEPTGGPGRSTSAAGRGGAARGGAAAGAAPAAPGAVHPRAGRTLGTVTTLRDHTELTHLTGEVETMRTLSDALRSQTHEFSNRLHTIVSLIELGRGDEALRFAADELDLGQSFADRVVASIDEPTLAALLLGKAAQARERSIDLRVDVEPGLGPIDLEPGDLVTIVGNLVDNAFDAVAPTLDPAARPARPPRVEVTVARVEDGVQLDVEDDGPGLDDVELAFRRGFSTKPARAGGRGIGLALVRQAVGRVGGRLDVTTGPDGTTFSVLLPDRRPDDADPPTRHPGGVRS
ncbi:sensor histidine kinase [Frigoribacterium sp. VKM Ac-2836]|uniref:ATP-binding protein n=1 Tax=Frigoribacterium sp. VKM Ac-2836 TaxID=2739014 RepID=UPI0015656118|nr:sensor histidine kinase [Frigoribacterium sp. VKM Ac-2836]NRD27672.1 sensor histidine kinase [Frigoribacterium sp. VKM Ac-2836]